MKKVLLSLLVLFLCNFAYAQSIEIKGKVTAADDGTGLPGVSISENGSTKGTMTDADGNYKITSAKGTTLVFSFVGMVTKKVAIGNQAVINVVLNSDDMALNEIVVTAGGLTAQRRELGNQATTIRAQELTQGKSSNIAAGLSGKVPGLLVSGVSSGVNPSYRIVLRGNRSLTGNNQALIVIDNMISTASILGNINPEDIQDIQVLNGAGAAALYGSDASNGALIVTTKKGRAGKSEFKISHTTTLEEVSFLPQIQDRFGSGTTPDDVPAYTPYENQQYGPALDGSMVQIGKPLQDGSIQTTDYSPKDSRYNFWETGVANQTDINVNSGSDAGTFYLSGQYFDQKSTVPGETYKRYSIRANSTRNITNKLVATFNTNFIANRFDRSALTGTAYNDLLMSPAQVDVTKYKDWRNDPFANPNGYFNEYYDNPYFTLDNNRAQTRNDYLQGNAELKWNPIAPLTFIARVGITTRNYSTKNTFGKFIFSDYTKSISGSSKTDIAGSVDDNSGYTFQLVNDFLAEYKGRISEDFSYNVVGGLTLRENAEKGVSVSASGLVIDGLYNVSNSLNNPGASEYNEKERQIGLFGKAQLSFRDYLYLNVTGRNDWRSILAADNRSFFYPSADVSFIVTDAIPALKDNNFLQSLKVRGGYSQVGQVSIGPYALNSTFSQAYGYPYSSGPGFTLNNTKVSPQINPEITTGIEGGFDFEIQPWRMSGGLTLYKTNTVDQTISVAVSSASGYSNLRTNVGEVQNKGLEAILDMTPIRIQNGVSIGFGINYTVNQNEVISLAEGSDELVLSSSGTASRILAKVGSPFPLLQVTQYNRDDQGRIIVDAKTGFPSTDGTFYDKGVTNAPQILGINTRIGYKGVRLYGLLEYRTGSYIYNAVTTGYDFSGAGIRTTWFNRDRFVIPNSSYLNAEGNYVANTNITTRTGGADFWTAGPTNTSIGENYANSAAFWKLREVSLSYDIPASLLDKAKFIKQASFSLQGRNLFIWTPDSNVYTDPEYSANGSASNAVGFTNLSQTPPARYYGATLSLTF